MARAHRTTDQASQGRDQGHRGLHILQENRSTLAAATGNDVTRDKWLWHRHRLDTLRMLHERGPACLPQIELLTCHTGHWSRAGHQRPTRWAGHSHADATVNRVVVWRVSKIAEAEGQGIVKLLLSANPGQLCSPLHMLHEPVRGTCFAAAASVQVNLSVVSQLQKTLSALRHGKVSPLLPSNPPQH